ncbi:MAG: hypothetical protein KGL39_37630 [Patescibacteria group bacterium]|nr:hypothetical protein [Patescibacteria group bacterium]
MATSFTDFSQAAPPSMVAFQPRYVFENELATFGLPMIAQQPNILNMIDNASTLIDEYCGRLDGDGHGSLVYSTYVERLLVPDDRNILRLMQRPLVVVDQGTVNALGASGSVAGNNFYTGVTANSQTLANGHVSVLIGASGRYGYGRRSGIMVYPDLNFIANSLQIASFFGGPPQWTQVDLSLIDFDPRTAEVWVPAGLYLSHYTELVVVYNSGYDPRQMPAAIKHACADIVKNALAMAAGVGVLKSISTGGALSMSFGDDLIDNNVKRKLRNFVTVLAY